MSNISEKKVTKDISTSAAPGVSVNDPQHDFNGVCSKDVDYRESKLKQIAIELDPLDVLDPPAIVEYPKLRKCDRVLNELEKMGGWYGFLLLFSALNGLTAFIGFVMIWEDPYKEHAIFIAGIVMLTVCGVLSALSAAVLVKVHHTKFAVND